MELKPSYNPGQDLLVKGKVVLSQSNKNMILLWRTAFGTGQELKEVRTQMINP